LGVRGEGRGGDEEGAEARTKLTVGRCRVVKARPRCETEMGGVWRRGKSKYEFRCRRTRNIQKPKEQNCNKMRCKNKRETESRNSKKAGRGVIDMRPDGRPGNAAKEPGWKGGGRKGKGGK